MKGKTTQCFRLNPANFWCCTISLQVVLIHRDGQAFEVEFLTLEGTTVAMVTLEASQVRPVWKREIVHARELLSR